MEQLLKYRAIRMRLFVKTPLTVAACKVPTFQRVPRYKAQLYIRVVGRQADLVLINNLIIHYYITFVRRQKKERRYDNR